jgi:hypothetical protein
VCEDDVKRIWDVPDDVRTVHLCACSPADAAELGVALEEAGIVWWVKPASSGLLTFLQRESQIFVDRTRVDEAAAIARRVVGDGGEG